MIVAGRLLEVVTGISYHDLLKREVYATVGMNDRAPALMAARWAVFCRPRPTLNPHSYSLVRTDERPVLPRLARAATTSRGSHFA